MKFLLFLFLILYPFHVFPAERSRRSETNFIVEREKQLNKFRIKKEEEIYLKYIKQNPKNKLALKRLADIYIGQEKLDKAIFYYEKLKTLDSDNIEYKLKLAGLYNWIEDAETAADICREIIKQDTTNVEARLLLAQYYAWKEDLENATKQYLFIYNMTSDISYGHKTAEFYMQNNKISNAINIYKNILKQNPTHTMTHRFIAESYLKIQKLGLSAFHYKQYLKQKPKDADVHALLSDIYTWQGKTDLAIKHSMISVNLTPNNIKRKRKLAKSYSIKGEFASAIAEYMNIIKIVPNDITSLLRLAEQYLYEKKYEKAKEFCIKIIEIDSANSDARGILNQLQQAVYGQIGFDEGLQAIYEGRIDAGMNILDSYINNNPKNLESILRYADICVEMEFYEKAIVLFKSALAIEPANKRARLKLIDVYLWGNKTEHAIAEFQNFLKHYPDDIDILERLAEAYSWTDNLEGAINSYENILKIDKNYIKAYEKLSDYYMWKSDLDKAYIVLKSLIEKKDNTEIQILKKMIDLCNWSNRQKEMIKYSYKYLEKKEDYDIRFQLAQVLMWEGFQDESIKSFEILLKIKPDNIGIKKTLADLYSWNRMENKAILLLQQIIEIRHEDFESMKKLGIFYWHKNNYNKARFYLKKVLENESYLKDVQDILFQIDEKCTPDIYSYINYYDNTNNFTSLDIVSGINWQIKEYAMKFERSHTKYDGEVLGTIRKDSSKISLNKTFFDYKLDTYFKYSDYTSDSKTNNFGFTIVKEQKIPMTISFGYEKKDITQDIDSVSNKIDADFYELYLLWELPYKINLSNTLQYGKYGRGIDFGINKALFLSSEIAYNLEKIPLTLSYKYNYEDFEKQDTDILEYSYFNPANYETHNFISYFNKKYGRIDFTMQNELFYIRNEDSLNNRLYCKLDFLLGKNSNLILKGYFTDTIKKGKDDVAYSDFMVECRIDIKF